MTAVPVDDAEQQHCLTDEQMMLGRGPCAPGVHIEQHYGRPMDIGSGHWTASMVSCTSVRARRRRYRAAPAA